jgi:hypothetical protein
VAARGAGGSGEGADLPDLAGVYVLLDIATVHYRAAVARHAGREPDRRAHRCFYNPLHDPAANEPDPWRGTGSKGSKGGKGSKGNKNSGRRSGRTAQGRLSVPACAECLRRIREAGCLTSWSRRSR